MQGTDNRPLFTLIDKWNKLTDEKHLKMRASEDSENDEETVTRFLTFLKKTAISYPKKTILIVTHGGIISVLLVKLRYRTYKNINDIKNAGFIKLQSDGVNFFVKETFGLESK